MAFVYNVHRVLKSIRTDEITRAKHHFPGASPRIIDCAGHLVRLSDIKKMHDEEHVRYEQAIRKHVFFDQDIPDDLFPKYEIESLFDNISNSAVGYSFIDDPRNNFGAYRGSYGQWLLSDPVRARTYAYIYNGQIVWKRGPTIKLLQALEDLRDILAPGVLYSTVLLVRGAEFSRALFRNTTGALRNLRIEMHLLAHVALQDKTSHQHLRDHHIPHPYTREWSHSLIDYLALLRPFEEHAVKQLFGPEMAHRYRVQLWPGLKGIMSAEHFGIQCGDMTERYMRQQFRPLAWRSLISAFGKRLPSSRAFEANEDLFSDLAMMHSSSMANKHYGRLSEEARHGDYRTTLGCVQAALDFQKHIGIGQSRPFTLGGPAEDVPVCSSVSEGDDNSITSVYSADTRLGVVLDGAIMERIARSVLHGISETLESRIKETVLDAMADVMARVLPKVPRPLDDNTLRLCSDVSPHPSRLHSLREFLNNARAEFTCPEQALLFELMCSGGQNVLGVLGTGKGKTLLVLLYAHTFRTRGTTVVVLPLSPLRDEYLRRAREMRVAASLWKKDGHYNPDASLLCVSVEDSGCDQFKMYVSPAEKSLAC